MSSLSRGNDPTASFLTYKGRRRMQEAKHVTHRTGKRVANSPLMFYLKCSQQEAVQNHSLRQFSFKVTLE